MTTPAISQKHRECVADIMSRVEDSFPYQDKDILNILASHFPTRDQSEVVERVKSRLAKLFRENGIGFPPAIESILNEELSALQSEEREVALELADRGIGYKESIRTLRDALTGLFSADKEITSVSDTELARIVTDDEADKLIREQAQAILRARKAINATKHFAEEGE